MTEHRHIGWLRAAGLSILVLVVTALGFLYVPDRLALALADSPTTRDLAAVLWTVSFFAVACWGFIRLQVRRVPDVSRDSAGSGEGSMP